MTRRALAIVVVSLACCSSRSEPAPMIAPPSKAASNPSPAAAPAASPPAAARVNPAPIAEQPPPANPAPVAEQPTDATRNEWLTFSRAPCFGTCPVYVVRVLSDGTVEYDGQAYVKQKGRRTKTLGAANMKQLRDLVSDPRFQALDAKCCNCYEVTDQDSATIEVREKAVTHAIVHYHGCTKAPEFLGPLEDSIDRVIGTEAWIGTPKQREKMRR